ncbi:hypothetical protein DF3PB_3030007 [uncultured Defluviicoccus sp.]|uniref:Uncharacterized protein n=1 Tax=metagenome TaxID=256318 RepID=A0A380TG46_9ZZZZ|nr:hypothetical protein DF3PB_3030007 [uncultured Defluviicoccus sp.]
MSLSILLVDWLFCDLKAAPERPLAGNLKAIHKYVN